MNGKQMDSRRDTRRKLIALATTLALGLLACAVDLRKESVPPQGWWDERGPVVPHDDFPADCSLCHEGDDWHSIRADFTFDHEAETGVALRGAHQDAECLRCHNDRGPVDVFARRGCAGCHEDVHRGQLGGECAQCHEETDWEPNETIAMHRRTRFPLVGSHAAVACWRCHPGAQVGNFANADVECVACHASDLARASDPPHATLGWTSGCDRCHIPTTWGGQGFNHPGFPLTGAHRVADCTACHAGGVFTGLSSECAACHIGEYNSTTDPNHPLFMFPTACERCHGTSTREGAVFDHAGISNGCATCHQADYDGTTDPNHVANAFPTACEQCHSTNAWTPAGFDHTGITSGCVDCHLDDYDATTDPNHASSGFPTSCEQCHQTNAWEPADFDHTGVSSGCAACHQDDYDDTDDPNHFLAGFPNTCELCHGTNDWDDADFDHDFPIETGDHRNLDCADCHVSPGNFSLFTCTDCHAHNKSDMDDEHIGEVDDYVWETSACYSCHPDGRADD